MTPVSKTLYQFLREQATANPEKLLLGDSNGWLTAQALLSRVEQTARTLHAMGIGPGATVGVKTHRCRATAVTLLALQPLGALAVLVDPRQDPERYVSGCSVPIALDFILDPTALPECSSDAPDFQVLAQDPKEPGYLIFTSGSTGKPKAVALSQYNLVNNLVDSQPLGYYTDDDIALGAVPMDHVFGLVLLAGICVLGYGLYLPESTDIASILHTIETEHITRMNGVPSLYLAMAAQAESHDLHSLRTGFIGGGPCTPEQFRTIEEKLDMTLISVYGMSECIGISCACWNDPQALRASGVGPFYPMNTGLILLEDGTPAPTGEVGEVCVRGPARMVGYYPQRMPEEEFLHTGDLGYVDSQGILHLTGRKKDLIIRNGNNLSPRKIEEALLALDGVQDAAVVGLPHELQGEVPYAMVVSKRKPEELLAELTTHLTKNELPVEIRQVSQLPLTSSGKPDKQRIREVLHSWKA